MTEVVAFKFEHLDSMTLRKPDGDVFREFTPAAKKRLEETPYTFTIKVNGRALLSGGVIRFWKDRGEIWSLVDQTCTREFIRIHKVVKRYINALPFNRLESTVDRDYVQGHRWMELLDFKLEAPLMKSYFPDGRDASLYAKVRA